MRQRWLASLLGFSLLLNVGVLGAVGYQAWQQGGLRGAHASEKRDPLVERLQLSGEQRRMWEEKERKFLRDMGADWEQVRIQRERMIQEIFSEQPDPAAIEGIRQAICRIQEKQQRQVIVQLMEEQQILDARQRKILAELLIQQKPAGSLEEHLHGH
ncbi:MAG TPA: periplasmic heavy metal sensor [Thiobacillaceae bacterium]|nr:periplasmic heavy metal sensor [Thiobacillaceae bacterium]